MIPTPEEIRLHSIFHERWESICPWGRRINLPKKVLDKEIKKWEEKITSLGMGFVPGWSVSSDGNRYVTDPASPLDGRYIVVSPELATKMLVLGDLP